MYGKIVTSSESAEKLIKAIKDRIREDPRNFERSMAVHEKVTGLGGSDRVRGRDEHQTED